MAEIPLGELTKDELYERATALQVPSRSRMTREQLLEAVAAALAEQAKPVEEPAPAPAPAEGTEAEAEPEQVESAEEHRKIISAKTEQLEMILTEPDMPPYLQKAIRAELETRRAKLEETASAVAARTELVRYVVTKGGRYVTKESYVTTLPVGSLVTPYTHDLEHVKRQGIEFELVTTLRTATDQLGRPVTEASSK